MTIACCRRVFVFWPGVLLLLVSNALAEPIRAALDKISASQPFIAAASEKFSVEARILSATIFTERMLNFDWTDETLDVPLFSTWHQNSSIGFAQIKAKTAYFIERQFADSTSVFYPGQKFEGLLSVSETREELTARLLSDSVNICYAAAYLRLMCARWERAGFPIHSRPEILGTLYSTGLFLQDGSERSPRINPRANEFGITVREAMILFTNDGSVKMAEYKDFVTKIRFKRWVRYLLPGLLFLALMPLFLIIAMKWLNPAKSSYMLQRLAAGREIRSQWTPLAEISPYMVLAVLAAEDIHFTRHNGFDFRQIRRAFVHNRLQRTSIGASTISQQVAKNLFLWPGKSYLRKALEGYLTILIELFWSKRRILEVYLNIAEMGPDLFGVGTASELYFRKSPSVLTPEEAASIAVALPNPGEYAVTHLPADLEEHKDKVLQTVLYLERIKYLKNF